MKRNIGYDIIRILAIVLVVLCHSTELVFVIGHDGNYADASFIPHALGRLGVPLFLMLTAALQMGKDFDTTPEVTGFWKSKVLPLYLKTAGWIIVFFVVDHLYFGDGDSLIYLIKELLFLAPVESYSQMWYMPFIIGIFFALPFIVKLLKTYDIKLLLVPVAIIALGNMVVPYVSIILGFLDPLTGSLFFYLNFADLGGYFIVYLVAGYLIVHRGWLERVHPLVFLPIAALAVLGIAGYEYWSVQKDFLDGVSYGFIFVCVAGVSLFLCIKNACAGLSVPDFPATVLKLLSQATLTVFFIHNLVLRFLWVVFPHSEELANSLLLFVLATLISFVLAVPLNRMATAVVSKVRKLI
jgi:surface polysaccharide O-acyltransferase-like enzyme